jgi:hypothetical protein
MNIKQYLALRLKMNEIEDNKRREQDLVSAIDQLLIMLFSHDKDAADAILVNKNKILCPENRALCKSYYSKVDAAYEEVVVLFNDIEFCLRGADIFFIVINCPYCGERTCTEPIVKPYLENISPWNEIAYLLSYPETGKYHNEHCYGRRIAGA